MRKRGVKRNRQWRWIGEFVTETKQGKGSSPQGLKAVGRQSFSAQLNRLRENSKRTSLHVLKPIGSEGSAQGLKPLPSKPGFRS